MHAQFSRMPSAVHVALALASVLTASIAWSSDTHASAGCTAVNAGGFNFGIAPGDDRLIAIPNFDLGDKISFVVLRPSPGGDGAQFILSDFSSSLYTSPDNNAATETTSYTIVGGSTSGLKAELSSLDIIISVTAKCVAAKVAATGPSDSDRLRSVQVIGTKIVAQTSGQAISGAVDQAISDGLSNPPASSGAGTFAPGPSGLGGPSTAAFAGAPAARGIGSPMAALDSEVTPVGPVAVGWNSGEWKGFANVRFGDAQRRPNDGGFDGRQTNVTAGLGRVVAPGLIIGILGGTETFTYNVPSLSGRLTGNGWTGGAYFGWKFAPRLRFDLTAAQSRIDYSATAGTAAGSFRGNRSLVSTGLTGAEHIGGFVIEPSARLFALWERQGGYTDSLGAAQGSFAFHVGRASAGAKVAYPWQSGGLLFTPYVGLYADRNFSSNSAVPAGAEILAIPSGWSARGIAGLTIGLAQGTSLSVGGEQGGIGTSTQQRTLTVRAALPF